MKNKKTSLWLAVIVTAIITACTQKHDIEKDFKAKPIDHGKGVEITEYVGEKWQVRVPSRIQNIPVTHIGERAFQKKELISVTIPDSVTSIGENAFYSCANLTSVTIPNSVTSIGGSAFSNTGLTSVTIPKSVTSIGWEAFSGTSLTSVTIPKSVISIGENAFAGCGDLTAINVASGNTNYNSDQGILYNKDKTFLIQYPRGKTDSTFIIPDSVTSIKNAAFQNCTNLTSVTIGNGVTEIMSYTFDGCTILTNVTIPDSVIIIFDHAFSRTGLTSITIPASVNSTESADQSHNFKGERLFVADKSVTGIMDLAFSDCNSLTSVTFEGKDAIYVPYFGTNVVFRRSGNSFPGDLDNKYRARSGGVGTYTRPSGDSYAWTKQ